MRGRGIEREINLRKPLLIDKRRIEREKAVGMKS